MGAEHSIRSGDTVSVYITRDSGGEVGAWMMGTVTDVRQPDYASELLAFGELDEGGEFIHVPLDQCKIIERADPSPLENFVLAPGGRPERKPARNGRVLCDFADLGVVEGL